MHRKGSRGQTGSGASSTGRMAGRDGRRDHLERRRKQIEAQISSIDARNEVERRKRETRANIIIGAVIRTHAALHPAFVPTLFGILAIGLRRQADRELLADILGLPQLAPDRESVAVGQMLFRQLRLADYAAEITARR